MALLDETLKGLNTNDISAWYRFQGGKSFEHINIRSVNPFKDCDRYVYFSKGINHHKYFVAKRLKQIVSELGKDKGFVLSRNHLLQDKTYKDMDVITFNGLYENSKQIVISSDRPPKDINPLEDRLRSRFEWGLIADISKPDYETRYAILRKKSELENILIDDEILSTLAFRIESNIRELEGTLNKMVARASLTNAPLTMQLAEQCISELQHSHEKAITIDYIQEAVAKYYNIDKEEFNISRRSNDIAFPRQIAMYLSKQLTGQPLAEIGKSFGGRDHTTVIYAINKIESAMKNNPNTKMIVDNIKKTILG